MNFAYHSMKKGTQKDKARTYLVDLIKKTFTGKIDILTLPGVWWNFEMELSQAGVEFKGVGLERKYREFKVASTFRPKNCTLVKGDILDYIDKSDKKFDFLWLDFMCPLEGVVYALPNINKAVKKNGILAITILKARDPTIKWEDRENVITRVMTVFGFKLIDKREYQDSVPMLQVTYRR